MYSKLSSSVFTRGRSQKPLDGVEELRIYQRLEICEILCRIETKNRYVIKTVEGAKLFSAVEHSCFLRRWVCLRSRPFRLSIYDKKKEEIIRMKRPLACTCSCLCACCPLQRVKVFAPPGNFVGSVHEKASCWSCKFAVKDSSGTTVFKIIGPCYADLPVIGSALPSTFGIFDLNGKEIGLIRKEWSGLLREIFTNSDFFVVKFPRNLRFEMKAVLLSACFLIDFMYYEK